MAKAAVTGVAKRSFLAVEKSQLNARIHPSDEAGKIAHFDRCAQQFEDFCVVSDSIRHGIPLSVQIIDAAGRQVYPEYSPGLGDAKARP